MAEASLNPDKYFDEYVICPLSGKPLYRADEYLSDGSNRYVIDDDIPMLFVDEKAAIAEQQSHERIITHAVQDFYVETPFPNYNSFDNIASFVRSADKSVFAHLLRSQLPVNAKVLEVGCGTGQLSNYLAATTLSHIYAADMTPASLRLGSEFARRNGIEGVRFLQMNLFKPCIRAESMDLVISNGVLHHTYDTKKAFHSIAPLVKPGGYIIIGLYNHIGRLRTDFRRVLVKMLGERMLFLDPHLRKNLSPEKRRAWVRDQYYHPQERKHSLMELMTWFDDAGFSFVSSIPKIKGNFTADEKLFQLQDPGTSFDRFLAEVGMLLTSFGGEGGLFICIGKKQSR